MKLINKVEAAFLCAVLALFQLPVTAQAASVKAVSFKDQDFKKELISQGVDANRDGIITSNEMAAQTYLLIDNANVEDLTGLEYAVNLKTLVIDGTNLSRIPTNIFSKLTRLESLELSGNKIASVPAGSFSGMHQLVYLYLDKNCLSTLYPNSFSGLTGLKYLYLNKNEISAIPRGTFNGMNHLFLLNLEKNHIGSLSSGVFGGLTSLKQIFLSGNDLTKLQPGVFGGPRSLSYIGLSDNKICSIAPNVFAGYYEYLFLDRNKLTDISSLRNISRNSNVDISWNDLNLSSNTSNMKIINLLLKNGVIINYQPQKG